MKTPFVEWDVASRALPGQADSGDRSLVLPQPDGALLAVVDGLGHGPEAARTAERAIGFIERLGAESPTAILARCHEHLQGTRGVTVSLARWRARAHEMMWLGVGDVEGLLLRPGDGPGRPREHLVRRVGVVGVILTPAQERTVTVETNSVLILATDGIEAGFDRGVDPRDRPEAIADSILKRFSREADDALVLVARLTGEER